MTSDATTPLWLYALAQVLGLAGLAALVLVVRVLADALTAYHHAGLARIRRTAAPRS